MFAGMVNMEYASSGRTENVPVILLFCGESGLEICGSNGSKFLCYHVFSFAIGMLMW